MSTRHAVIVAVVLLSAGCRAQAWDPQDIVVDRTACSQCGMLVSELTHAAAYQVPGREPRVFDDIGCMLDAVRHETAFPSDVWVQDASGGGWLDADQATFVTSPRIRTPMNGGVLAYAHVAAAERAAAAQGGEVMGSLHALVARKGAAQ